jgi:hypothetical protein
MQCDVLFISRRNRQMLIRTPRILSGTPGI